ncbi:MAG: N-6 DNA methylase [Pseudomonadota bacterium]
MSNNDIVQKLWNLCDILRDDGINYSDYVTELVLLLFIKMEYENAQSGVLNEHKLPEYARWPVLTAKSGITLLNDYRQMLLDLAKSEDPLIAAIYADAQTRLREPRHLEQLIKNLDSIDWFSAKKDGLGDLYEGLLEKNASETKSGAGQYFTPRPLIDSIIELIQPQPGETIQDPAAGTAGFLIAADAYVKSKTDQLYDLPEKARKFQRKNAYLGMELVPGTRRLALMNCLLHGMEGDEQGVVHLGNTLGSAGASLPKADIILSNPPFGTAKGGGGPTRDDLTYQTSNKQLAFLQHIYRHLKDGGRAAVVLPDNVLFEAGQGTDIRRDLMNKCNLHTILRLPTGIFYAQGVKTNVLFFQKISDEATNSTKEVWVYDMRANMPKFGKRTPFTRAHFTDFETAFSPLAPGGRGAGGEGEAPKEGAAKKKTAIAAPAPHGPRTDQGETGRFRVFSRDWIKERGDSLDISWLKDDNAEDASELPEPAELAREAMTELESAMNELRSILSELEEVRT